MKHLLTTMAVLLYSLVASAEKVEIDGIWYNLVSKIKQAEVTYKGNSYDSYSNEYSGSITLPATVTYDGVAYSVTSIGWSAFRGCRSLTAITIPEGVTSIGSYAFRYCESLTAITIPENSQLTSIGEWAFEYCESLTAITLPEGVTSIGDYAFYGCSSLTAITIPESVTSIGGGAFLGCSSLTAITIPEGVTSIGDRAFSECSSLTAINIPEGVTSIGEGAFNYCSSLTAITLPEGVTSIGDWAFYGCSSLTAITLPEGVTSIGKYAFSECSNLTAIIIPKSVTSIGSSVFYNCSSLTAINIPEGVTSIGSSVFQGCSSLTSIVLPKNLKNIDSQAFANCSELLDVYCYAEKVPSTESNAFDGSYPEYVTLHVPAIALNAYKTTVPWSSFGKFETLETNIPVANIILSQSSATLLVGASLTLTATVTPDDATDKSITWSSSNPSVATVDNTGKVTAIATGTATITATANDGSGVKASCEASVTSTAKVQIDGIWYNLVSKAKVAEVTRSGGTQYSGSITIPATVTYDGVSYSVTSIGEDAFYYCWSLTAITLPEGVTSIGDSAFDSCSSLTDITLPESVTSIGNKAFVLCESLTAITIPESVTSIGNKAFYGCSSLTAINIPEGSQLTSIGDLAFFRCSSLTDITIPGSVTSIGDYAFEYCSSLTDITIPENSQLTSIGDEAFCRCSSLTDINIPEGVTSIGNDAFYYCSSLTAINIPENSQLTSIGDWAFTDCSSLTAINIPEGVTSIGERAFYYCSSLTAITVAEGNAKYDSRGGCNAIIETNSNTLIAGCSTTVIPESVTSIGYEAFSGCSSLTDITIPEGVTSIGAAAFYECRSLTDITCHAVTPPKVGNYYTFYGVKKSIPVYVPEGSVEDYKAAEYWKDFTNITALTIPTEVTITINQYGSGTYCSEYALDFSNVEGLKAYAATGYNELTGVVTLTRVMTAKDGVGLFIKGESGEYIVPIMENSVDNTLNMLVGTLAKTSVNATSADGLYANYKYTIKEGDSQPLFYQFADGSTLGAGKAYLQIPVAWLPQTSETKSISLRFEEGEGTTDIENSQFTIDNSQLTYDLFGRRVDNPVKGGIYIVGGRKVVY